MLSPKPVATPGNTGTGYATWRTRSDTSIEWDRAAHTPDRFLVVFERITENEQWFEPALGRALGLWLSD